VTSFSQHPEPTHALLHLSDTHLLGDNRKLHGVIDTDQPLRSLLERVVASNQRIDALVFTGDLAERAERSAYERLADLVAPYAGQLRAQVIWVMGNHDEREPFASVLYGEHGQESTQDRVFDLRGLRVIALDTSVPGYHHGEIDPDQREWLRGQLATPAEHGTLLAVHHPPIPTPVSLMGMIEMDDQEALGQAIEGSDVRGILAGHLHYTTHSLLAGVPVSVVAASCYNVDLIADHSLMLRGSEAGKLASIVHVYPDRVVFSAIPFETTPTLVAFESSQLAIVEKMTPQERRDEFSRKTSAFNQAVDRKQAGD